jgi:uncharacterized protein YjiS (DUF1127 family)
MSTSPLSPLGPERPFDATGPLQATLAGSIPRWHLPGPIEVLGVVLAAIVAWHGRWQQRRRLARLDARMLRDIGLTRDEARREIRKPFWQP